METTRTCWIGVESAGTTRLRNLRGKLFWK